MNPGEITSLIILSAAGWAFFHFSYLKLGYVLEHHWRYILAVFFMSSLVVSRISRFFWIKLGRKEVGGMTAYSGREFGAGNLPLEVERPDGR